MKAYRPKRRGRKSMVFANRRYGSRPATIKDNSAPWTQTPPTSVEEAIAISDQIKAMMREWGLLK